MSKSVKQAVGVDQSGSDLKVLSRIPRGCD